jgi:putative oxidoreductase
LFSTLRPTPLQSDLGLLLLRLWFGTVLALAHGFSKVSDLPKFIASVSKHGIPLPEVTAPFAALSELAGGLLLALGLFTRPAGLAVCATMLVAAFHVHGADPFKKQEFALAYAAAGLALALTGPGRFSVDAWWRTRRQSTSQASVAPSPPRD